MLQKGLNNYFKCDNSDDPEDFLSQQIIPKTNNTTKWFFPGNLHFFIGLIVMSDRKYQSILQSFIIP